MYSQLVDSVPSMKAFLDRLPHCEGTPPSLYVDLEGNKLSRNGTLSLITIFVAPLEEVYLIDVTELGHAAFTTAGSDLSTLQKILESEQITKVFFDIRRDSDAMFSHFGVRVGGIEDLQLMELASRDFNKRWITGLGKCIEKDSKLSDGEKQKWQKVKENGLGLFDPKRGGSYSVFDHRPLSSDITEYCMQDVTFVPHLREVYRARLCDAWWLKIEEATRERIRLSQSTTFNPDSPHMAEGPHSWLNYQPTPAEKQSRSFLDTSTARASEPISQETSTLHHPSQQGPISEALTELAFHHGANDRAATPTSDTAFDDIFERDAVSEWYDDGGDEDDFDKDLTACDKECGYCGRCPY